MDRIVYFDRYRRELCEEQIYGENYLRWIYETPTGRIALSTVVKRLWFSRWYGWRMNRAASRERIDRFINVYGLDPSEFESAPEDFRNFNEFFSRRLKPEARPIEASSETAVFPADGRHLCIPDLSLNPGLFVKGQMFDVFELVGDRELARPFADGALLLSRLCPVDYHRFHFPASGIPGPSRLINGPLYSVNPIALSQNIRILATNRRSCCILETERFGRVLLLEVGATCVGSIRQTYSPDHPVGKGDEKGFFQFGGSSTITLFQRGAIIFDEDIREHSADHRELYARMGDRLGRAG